MSSLAYPIARTLEDALKPDAPAARTRSEAEAQAEGEMIEALTTEWLNVTEEEAAAYLRMADSEDSPAQGYLQRYEDNEGKPVLAVTWWKLAGAKVVQARIKAAGRKPEPEKPPAEDHTDDLYFRSGRTKPRRRRYVDPRQLDLFRNS